MMGVLSKTNCNYIKKSSINTVFCFFDYFCDVEKNKFYVVWQGRQTGVFSDWNLCKEQVEGFGGALYKGFPNREQADKAFAMGYQAYRQASEAVIADRPKPQPTTMEGIISQAIAVDAACSGNPGKMEYRGVFVETNTEIFKSCVYDNGTNNIGEFLAIVHALSYQKKYGLHYPIYSDSVNAQLWIRQKKCKTKLQPNARNAKLFEVVARAEQWLHNNSIDVPILKWRTEIWGEIPADFGRK